MMDKNDVDIALIALQAIGASRMGDKIRVTMPEAQFEVDKVDDQYIVTFRTSEDAETEQYDTLLEALYNLQESFYDIIRAAFEEGEE